MKRVAFVLTAMLIPWSVSAQSASASSGLNRTALPTVFVLDDRGVETRGKLLQLDEHAVVLLVGNDHRRFETRSVTRVSKRGDSLKNGAIAGAVVGLVLGALTAGLADCPRGDGYSSCGAGTRIAMTAMSGCLYAAIGTSIDAAIPGRTTLYEAAAVRRSAASTRSGSFALRLSW